MSTAEHGADTDYESGGHPLEDVIDDAIAAAHGDTICLDDLLHEYGTRSFGPALVIAALTILSPLGGIPGLPIILGGVTVLLAVQIVFGAKHIWVPRSLHKIGFNRQKTIRFRDKSRKWLIAGDRLVKVRLEWLAGRGAAVPIALCLIFLSLMMIPLELVPFAATLPAVAMLFFGLGLMARDGLMCLFGYALTLPSIWMTLYWWPFAMPGGWSN